MATTRRGRATRARILEAARDVIAVDGYAGASIASVAARAGVATGTPYRHFPSKEALYAEVVRQVCEREVAAVRIAAADTPGGAVERLVAVIALFVHRALRSPRLAWALLAEPMEQTVDEIRLEFRRRYRDDVAALLAEAVEHGEVPEQDATLVAAALVGGVADAIVGPLAPVGQDAPDTEAVVAGVVAFVRRAIGAPTG